MAKKCNACGITEVYEVFSLGELYVSNFIPMDAKSEDYPKSKLDMAVCMNCRAGQLLESVNPDSLYKKKYWYYSGVNQTMHDALEDIVRAGLKSVKIENGDIWLDIASNDGTLLSYVPDKMTTIGIDPADEEIMKLARMKADYIVNDYFSEPAYRSVFPTKNAKVISCAAMFYDLDDPKPFLDEVRECMHDDGVFICQVSYTPLMLKQLEFGNICAEHIMYYDVRSLVYLFNRAGLRIVDVEFNDVNGGSVRVYATKWNKYRAYKNQQCRDIGDLRRDQAFLTEEMANPYWTYSRFFNQIQELALQTNGFIRGVVRDGKTVYGYGASTKGNTLLQYFDLGKFVTKIADRNSAKWGLKTIGTEIPICSEEEMRKDHPDYLLILPWHFIDEFKEREHEYLSKGGKFIVPSPKFEVIGL